MIASRSSDFRHTTLTKYPDRVVGVTLLNEEPGFTGIYLRDAQGGLYPARTVSRRPAAHHKSVVDAWIQSYGGLIDRRKKTHGRRRSRRR